MVGVMGIGQLIEFWRGKVDIELAPKNVYAFDDAGRPVQVEITVGRAGSTLETVTIDMIPESSYSARDLTLG